MQILGHRTKYLVSKYLKPLFTTDKNSGIYQKTPFQKHMDEGSGSAKMRTNFQILGLIMPPRHETHEREQNPPSSSFEGH